MTSTPFPDRGAGSAVRPFGLAPPPGTPVPQPHPGAPVPGSILPPHSGGCYGCGPEHPCGLRLAATVAEGGCRVTGRLEIDPLHQGAPGLAHGGVVAAAFDEILGYVMWLVGAPSVTGRLEADFVRPLPVGSTLYISAWAEGRAGRKIWMRGEGRLNAADGPLAVRAAALFVVVGAEHFAAQGGDTDMGAAAEGVQVLLLRLDPGLPVPAYAHDGDAGADLCAAVDVTLAPGERALVPTGVALALPEGYAGFVHPRSGLAARQGLSIVNAPGTVDAGYRGEIQVALINLDSTATIELRRGDRIAQLVVQRVERARFVESVVLPPSGRGDGGHGSTGGFPLSASAGQGR